METKQKATLGCGTLILLAVIVLTFTHAGNEDAKREVRQLREEVKLLQSTVTTQSRDIQDMKRMLKQIVESKVQEGENR